MGGIVDGGAGISIKTSPRQAAIEKIQAELRQEYDVRDKRRRELEFLEKGGNPLDFKFGNAASVSIQSTSLVDRHKEQFLSGEAKVGLALTASTHVDSIESNDRPGVTTTCEHNSADSHLHFDGGTEVPEGDKKFLRLDRKNSIAHPDQSVKTDSNHSAKESEDSAIFRPYARRNRSRLNRDSGRSSSTDLLNYRASHGSSLPTRSLIKDSRVPTLESSDKKEQNPCSVSQAELPDNDNGLLSKSITPETCLGNEVDVPSLESSISRKKTEFLDVRLDTARRLDQHAEWLTDTLESSADVPCKGIGLSGVIESEVSADAYNLPSAASIKADPEMSGQLKSVSETVVNDKATVNEALNSNVAANSKALDSESSSACSTEKMHIDPMNIDQQTVRVEEIGLARAENVANGETANGQIDNVQLKGGADGAGDNMLWRQNCIDNVMTDQGENRSHSNSTFGNEEHTPVEPKREETELLADNTNMNEEICADTKPNGPTEEATSDSCKSIPPARVEVNDHEVLFADCHSRLAAIVNGDSVLEEAKIIEAKRKRIAELSIGTVSFEERHRSHWEFVLEEMAWLANDFAQERLWKSTTASQLCCRAAFASRLRLKKKNMQINHKKVAFTLAKDVMQFWRSMDNNLNVGDGNGSSDGKVLRDEPVDSGRDVDAEGSSGKVDPDTGQELGYNMSLQSHIKLPLLQSYAVQFLRQTNSHVPSFRAESPDIVDVTSESDSQQVSWRDHLTEENLFYTIPPGAMETYRNLIEYYILQHEGTGNIQGSNTRTLEVGDYGYLENAHNEGEEETGAYYLPGAFEGSKSLKLSQKKRKATTRPYELEADSPYRRYSVGTQLPMRKRPTNFVGQIPTKRFRSASRPRFILPSGTATSVRGFPAPSKNDASSGDTSSFQDDQSVIPSALRIQKCGEVNSFGDYGSRLSHDMAETSTKSTKKKKLKYTGSQFEQYWQMDSPMLAEQWDQSKRRSENHHFESNGTSGLYEQLVIKKPKFMKHSADNSFDNIVTGSIPSPVASQSVSNPKKILKIFNGRDGGRKTKTLKTLSVQPGSGSSWSQFEDQALVVLVHDMGPNWELVSDAINSILQLKCVYRNSAECKEHHKVLMDKTANDGADSTEDSGSSQSYPFTLPGIPKGSARQLFQRLQGPFEEDVMREHFNKIIQIGQKQRCNKMQNESHDLKQMAVHNSHFVALSQVCPNNLNGVILTPLDLCEDASADADILLPLGYQGSHGNSVAATNQGSVASVLSNSGTYTSLRGSCGPVCSPNLLLPSTPHNAPSRDGRYHVQRPSTPLSDEQHRGQQHGHVPPNRNIQQSKLSVSGPVSGNDRGIRTFPNGNNIGIPTATNRSIPTSRPAFQGLTGPPAMNHGSMLSSGLVGALSSENLHMGSNSRQGTQLMRPREALHSARQPGNSVHQRQMMAPEMQMQVAQGNTHGIPAVNGMGSGFSNQATSPVSTSSAHSQTPHQNPPQQSSAHNCHQNTQVQGTNHSTEPHSQAYVIRLAKERQLQQRHMQQHQQQHFASSGSLMSHAQPPPQLPLSSALANSAQIPLQSPAPPVLSAPLTPSSPINPMTPVNAQKVPMQASGVVRNAQSGVAGITIQVGEQRQRQLQQQQQFQRSGRQHPQQQHSTQALAKVPRGGGRGNAMVHQNLPNESSQSNGISITPGSSVGKKELMRGQGMPLTIMRPVQKSKPLASQPLNHPQVSLQTSSEMAPHLKQFQQQHQPHTSGQNLHHSNSSTPLASNHLEVQAPQLTNKRQFPLTQSIGARMVPQTQVTHEPLIESQLDCKGDADSVSNTLMVSASKGMALASHDSAGSPPICWRASEPLFEEGVMSATGQMGRCGNLAFSGPVRSDSLPSVNQGLWQRQKSDLSSSHGQGTGVVEEQRETHNTPLKHSSALSPPPQQQYRAVEQVLELEQLPSKEQPLHSQPHHQTQHLLASQRNSCTRQANSDVE